MPYQKKYWLNYKSLKVGDTKTYTLELWQNSAGSIIAEEIKGGQSPFVLEMPELSHKFQVVRGRGCVISLLSDTDMKFFEGLKHIDPQEFKINHKIDGVIDWTGYLNSDMYSEPYDQSTNYIISTTGNDGFSLMDRYRFLQPDGQKYTGLKSEYEILQICLDKVGLTYNDIRIKLATTIQGFTIPVNDTILHSSTVNCANFYDEDGLGMTMREVLESILAPYGAFIFQDNGSIYISDIHTLAGGGSITFKTYSAYTYLYSSDETVIIEKDIYDVGYFGTGHNIDRSGGTNLQKVIYSPYPQKNIINETIITPNEFTYVPATFDTKITSGGFEYKYRYLTGHPNWNVIFGFSLAYFEESYGLQTATALETDRKTYVVIPMYDGSNMPMIESIFDNMYLSIKKATLYEAYVSEWKNYGIQDYYNFRNGAAILLTGKLFARTKNNPYNVDEKSADIGYVHGISYVLKIGDYYFNEATNSWSTTPYYGNFLRTTKEDYSIIADKWVDIGVDGNGLIVQLGTFDTDIIHGKLEFTIWSNTYIWKKSVGNLYNDSSLKETWITGLSMQFVNNDGSEIADADSIYNGYLNKLFAQEGEPITLTTGTATGYTDYAKLMRYSSGEFVDIKLWTRAGQTYKIEELLLNSLCSNYRDNFITLIGMKLKNEFSLLSIFTDTTFLEDNPKLMIKSSSIDYANYEHSVTLVEVSEDDLTIIKE